MKNQFYQAREFLNNPDSSSNAFIACDIVAHRAPEYHVTITDCSAEITLHEYLESKNAVHKLDVLISNLQNLKNKVQEVQILQKACVKKYKTKELAETALNEISENPLLKSVKHQLEVFSNRAKTTFSIRRNNKIIHLNNSL